MDVSCQHFLQAQFKLSDYDPSFNESYCPPFHTFLSQTAIL